MIVLMLHSLSTKKYSALLLCILISGMWFSTSAQNLNAKERSNADFKIIGYFSAGKIDTIQVPYEHLTHINYAFVIPTKEADGSLSEVPRPEVLKNMVRKAHTKNVEVFISIGGWNIGDGGGIDDRFEKLANHPESRTRFTQSVMEILKEYDLDGADIDWEYPDPILPSSQNNVLLMQELGDSLHKHDKKLTAAVVSYHDRYGYGIQDEIFEIVDWLNLMAYDDDYNTFGGEAVPHSPYWLAVRSFEYWVKDRGLSAQKAVMGVPFYGKGENGGGFKELLERGADPYADEFEGSYYNGIKTIKEKTRLAKKWGTGIMVWEIPLDTPEEHSLLKAIYEEAKK